MSVKSFYLASIWLVTSCFGHTVQAAAPWMQTSSDDVTRNVDVIVVAVVIVDAVSCNSRKMLGQREKNNKF